MDLTGEEKRIRALFRELRREGHSQGTAFRSRVVPCASPSGPFRQAVWISEGCCRVRRDLLCPAGNSDSSPFKPGTAA